VEYHIVTKLSEKQIEQLEKMFQVEWWTKGREFGDIKMMVENSDIIIGCCDPSTNELIGFTRVLTDYVYKAFIFDVIVEESYRGKDLGRVLIDSVLKTPSLQEVKHFELYCLPEMVSFYKKWGFSEELGELTFMRKVKK
jgi:predicted GNAT family N-acyltransferase